MKQYIKSMAASAFSPIAARLGFKKIGVDEITVVSNNSDIYAKNNLLHSFFTILKQLNFKPIHIVDVGANHGTWTRETLKYFPDAYYTLLEPQQQLQASVNDILQTNSKIKFHAIGAGIKNGTFKFTIVDRDDSCTFIYSEAEAARHGFKQIECPVVTLNDFLPATKLPVPDIIKIDAEGLDLEVLSGANNYLGATEIFITEAGVMGKAFDNSVLKIMNFMDHNGYRLLDITDLNRTQKHNALWLVELVFIKKEGIIDQAIYSYI